MIDGEAVILGVDGISDFNALHSGRHNEEVQLWPLTFSLRGRRPSQTPLHLRRPILNDYWLREITMRIFGQPSEEEST